MTAAKAKKAKKKQTKATPIYVALLLCDHVIFEKNGLATIIRVIDTISLYPNEKREIGDHLELSCTTLYGNLRAESVAAECDIDIVCVGPSGDRRTVSDFSCSIEIGRGAHFACPLRVVWDGPGLYWLELVANGVTIGKTPVLLKVGKAVLNGKH